MVLPFLALYMTRELEVSPGKAGFVLGVYGAGGLITSPIAGKLSDKFGSLLIMKISLLVTGALLFLYPFFNDYFFILIITLIWAIISESFRPANMSLIANVVHPEQRRTAYALNRLAINLGMSIGPVIGGFLAVINFQLIFFANAFTTMAAGIFLISSKWHTKETQDKIFVESADYNFLSFFNDKKYLYFLVGIIPVQMVFFQHIGAMPLFLVKDLGYNEAVFGLLSAINTVLIIFIEVPLVNYLAHWSDRKLLAVGSLLTAIGFGSMAVSRDIYTLIITIVIWTFGEMILFPSSANYVSHIAPPEKRGVYMGFYMMTFSFAFALGPWLGTAVFQYYGAVVLWIGTFFFAGISSVMMLKLNSGS
jgi:MFS family permease